MYKEISPNFTSAVLIGFMILILAVLPFRIQIVPNTVSAQETPATSQTTTVAHVDANVVEYTLRMELGGDPAMAFVGVGGTIDGIVNSELSAHVGDTVHLTVINGDPVAHDLTIDEFKVSTGEMVTDEQTVKLEFTVTQAGEFKYYCSVPGHRQIGMEGVLRV